MSYSVAMLSVNGPLSAICSCVQNEQFPYCQSWVLGWQYRKQNLLKELLGYSADIVCLQEVH